MEEETLPELPSDELLRHREEFDAAMKRAEERSGTSGSPPEAGILETVGKNLLEVPGQIVRGAAEGLNAANSGAYDLGTWLNDNIVDLGSLHFGEEAQGVGVKGWLTWSPGVENTSYGQIPDSVLPSKPDTATGQIVNDAAQLGVGLIGASKFIKMKQMAGAGATVVRGMIRGAAADAAVFDGNDERLSNFVEKYPSLQNPVTEFLASKDDDNEALGRLKNAAEGLIVGPAVEALLYSVRVSKAVLKGNKEEAAKILDEVDAASDAAKATPDPEPLKPTEGSDTANQGDLFAKSEITGEVNPVPEAKAPEISEASKVDENGQLDMGLEGSRSPDSPAAILDETSLPATPSAKYGLNPVKKLIEVDDAGFQKILKDRDWQENSLLPDASDISGIRTDLIENGDDIKGVLDTLTRVYSDEMTKARGGNSEGVRTWENVERNAERISDIIGGSSQMVMQRMAAQHKNLLHIDAELRAYGDFMATVGKKVYDLSEFVSNPNGALPAKYASRSDMMADFAKHYELMANVQGMYRGMQTNVARSLNAFKIGSKVNKGMLAHMNPDELFAGGPKAMEKLAKQIKATGGDTKAIAMTTRPGFLKKVVGSAQEYWINAILSSPKTQLVNLAGSLANTVFQPSERMLSGALRSGTKEGRADFISAGAEVYHLFTSAGDAVRLAARAFKEGNSILDPMRNAVDDLPDKITSEYLGIDGRMGSFVNALGVAFRLPSRLMMTTDEFVKQMSYRASIKSGAVREHLLRDQATDTQSLTVRIQEKLDASVDADGKYIDEIAMDQARTATFSQDLSAKSLWNSERTFGESLQAVANNHPAVRMVLPFIRTPTNVARFVWTRTPGFNMVRKEFYDDAVGKNGRKAQADAQARTIMGAGMWTVAAGMAFSGEITGGGPADTDLRRELEATGWKPYARVHTDPETGKKTFTQYNRMDPFGMFFGLAADFTEAANHVGQGELEDIALNMTIALARNLQSKTYMSGLTQAIEAISNPDRKMQRWAGNMLSSFIPAAVQSVANDPYMRETRSMLDFVRRKVPGYSEAVDPIRNVFGEKVLTAPGWGPDWLSPFAQGVKDYTGNSTPVSPNWQVSPQQDPHDELSRLSYISGSVIRPTDSKLEGVDLTQFKHPNGTHTASDRYAELVGSVRVNGRTIKEEVTRVIRSPMYARATDGDDMHDGSRIEIIRRVVGGYRSAAQNALFKESPEIRQAVDLARYETYVAKGAVKKPSPPAVQASNQP